MKKRFLHILLRTFRFAVRHAPALIAALCCMFAARCYTVSLTRTTLYERVQAQPSDTFNLPGKTITLDNALTMYLPEGWTDITSTCPDAAHPACIAAYQGRDAIGRKITMVVTRWENVNAWAYNEEDSLCFVRWFAGSGQTCYRVFVSAQNAFCASSSTLCRSLNCMLRSIRSPS